MLDHLILMISLLGSGHVGLGTVFGSSRWDRSNPHSRLACLHREIDDRRDLIIAHNTLPCGTRVWIFNPRTGRSVVASVADRGPRHAYADLSREVARRLGHNGREDILVVRLPAPRPRLLDLPVNASGDASPAAALTQNEASSPAPSAPVDPASAEDDTLEEPGR